MYEFKNYQPLYVALKTLERDIPVLDIGHKTYSTDSIDFVSCDDMKFPIMKGIDKFKRLFLAIKVDVEYIGSAKNLYHQKVKQVVGVFFQKYADNAQTWCYGTMYPPNIIIDQNFVCNYNHDKIEILLKKIFKGDSVIQINEESAVEYIDRYGYLIRLSI